jgi:uncharacterized protein (TIGR00369 family)
MKIESEAFYAVTATQQPVGRIPADFVQLSSEAFVNLVGPIYRRTQSDGRLAVGFLADSRHANLFGSVHGGMLATLADCALGIAVLEKSLPDTRLGTVSLSVDFIAGGRVGEWIEASVTIHKDAGRLRFASCAVSGEDGRVLLRAGGVFSAYIPGASV